MKRSVSDREHRDGGAFAARSMAPVSTQDPRRQDHCDRQHPTETAHGATRCADRHHDRGQCEQRCDGMQHAELCRPESDIHRRIDETNLQPRRQPGRGSKHRREIGRQDSKEHLRIRDHKGERGERRAEEREHRAERLHRTEVRERDRHARHERRAPRRERPAEPVAPDADDRMRSDGSIVSWEPAKPSDREHGCEVTQREHASEAQLKARICRDRRPFDQHRDARERKQAVAVPVPASDRAQRADHRHERRPCRARCGHHHEHRDRRHDQGEGRLQPRVTRRERGDRRGDPPQHREIESRDREDVRQPDRTERPLDRRIAVFRSTENERDQHRADAVRAVVGNARDDGRMDPVAQRGARRKRRTPQRPRVNIVEHPHEFGRFDRDEAGDAPPRSSRGSVELGRHRHLGSTPQRSEDSDARPRPHGRRRTARNRDDARVDTKLDRRALLGHDDDFAERDGPSFGLLEVPRERIGRERAASRVLKHRRLDRDKRSLFAADDLGRDRESARLRTSQCSAERKRRRRDAGEREPACPLDPLRRKPCTQQHDEHADRREHDRGGAHRPLEGDVESTRIDVAPRDACGTASDEPIVNQPEPDGPGSIAEHASRPHRERADAHQHGNPRRHAIARGAPMRTHIADPPAVPATRHRRPLPSARNYTRPGGRLDFTTFFPS